MIRPFLIATLLCFTGGTVVANPLTLGCRVEGVADEVNMLIDLEGETMKWGSVPLTLTTTKGNWVSMVSTPRLDSKDFLVISLDTSTGQVSGAIIPSSNGMGVFTAQCFDPLR